jgi:hypothetical protein
MLTHDQLVAVLNLIRPGSHWTLRGDELEWLEDNNTRKPTEKELANGLKKLEALAYREQRATAYPALADQLDALWKGGDDLEEMRRRVLDVKTQFPKPE